MNVDEWPLIKDDNPKNVAKEMVRCIAPVFVKSSL